MTLRFKPFGVLRRLTGDPRPPRLRQPRLYRSRVFLLARLALLPYGTSSLRLLRRRGSHEAGALRDDAESVNMIVAALASGSSSR
jgi:hypothetical protein